MSKKIFGKKSCKSIKGVKSQKKFLENFSENRGIYIIMKRIIKLTESELIEMVRRVITEESDEIKKISDLERFYYKEDTSLNDYILNVVNKTMDMIDPNGFKNEDHFLEQIGGLITFKLLKGGGFYFKQKDEKYKNRVKEFLFEYIPKKYKSKIKSKWNKR